MYQHHHQYSQYPTGFNHPNFGQSYPSNSQVAQSFQPQAPYVPPPQNYYAFTRDTLTQVLEKLSELIENEFRGLSIRLVAHGGACVLLHSGLHEIADRRATHSGFLVETQRFTTRDVDYIHRSFVAEYEKQGIMNPGERLKRCISETAVQMGHSFSLGVDWMNSDADMGLPLHEDLRTGLTTDPVYTAAINPDNIRRNTVFTSRNNKLTIVCVPAAWSVALKLHRYSLKDSSDICLFLILESRNRSTPWTVESVKHWLESECPDMNYKNFDRHRLIERRERIEGVLAVLATTNNGALEYNIDQVQAFLPDGKTGIQPRGTGALPDPRPVSTDRFQIGTVPHFGGGWHPNPNLSSREPTTVPREPHRLAHHNAGYPQGTQHPSQDFFVPPDIGSESISKPWDSRPAHTGRYDQSRIQNKGRRSNRNDLDDSSSDDEDSSDDSDSSGDTEEDTEEDIDYDANRRRIVSNIYRNTATPGSSRRNVTIWEPPPEILSVEEQTAKQMSRLVVQDRPATPYSLDDDATQIHQGPSRQPPVADRDYSIPLQQQQRQYSSPAEFGTNSRSGPISRDSSIRRQRSSPLLQAPVYPPIYGPGSSRSLRSRTTHRDSTYSSTSRPASPTRHSQSSYIQDHDRKPRSSSPDLFIPPLPTEDSRDPFTKSWGNLQHWS